MTYDYIPSSSPKRVYNYQLTAPLAPVMAQKTKKKQWSYGYSYYYDWLKQEESTKGVCMLNNQQEMLLTTKNLYVQRSSLPPQTISLHKIEAVSIHFKRLLFPVIIGGIVASISALATLNGVFNAVMGFFIVLSALALFYYGWQGTYQITLQLQANQHINYFIDEKNSRVEQFITLLNNVLANKNK